MKKTAIILALALAGGATTAHADITSLIKSAAQKASSSTSTTTTDDTSTTSTSSSSSSSSLLDKLTSAANALGVISSKTVDADYLAGTWQYVSPAVAFQSESLLSKAGGVAASEKIVSELEPYYTQMGLNTAVFTFTADNTFTLKIKSTSLEGTFEANSDGSTLTFNFTFKGKKITSMTTYVNAISTSQMDITFDVSKLMSVLKTVGSVTSGLTGSTAVSTMSSLLDNYEGVTCGFKMKKQ